MGVYIKGMEMPTNCCQCPVNMEVCKRGYKYLLAHPELYDNRADDCPLVPVPPHGRMGDLDAFESVKYELPNGQKAFNRGFHSGVQFMQRLIMDAPTIIPAGPAEEG